MVADAVAFFAAFEGMEQGFRDRAAKVEELLVGRGHRLRGGGRRPAGTRSRRRSSSPTGSASRSGRVEALVVNRMFPSFGPVPPSLDGAAGPTGTGWSRRWSPTWPTWTGSPSREEQHVAVLAERLPGAPVVRVPFLADDVHDLDGLTEVGRWLFDPSAGDGAADGLSALDSVQRRDYSSTGTSCRGRRPPLRWSRPR